MGHRAVGGGADQGKYDVKEDYHKGDSWESKERIAGAVVIFILGIKHNKIVGEED